MAAGNVIENPDFQVVSGSSPQNWHGYGNSSISIAPGVKFNGKNCCLCTKRKHPYSAIGQNVVYAVQNGQLFTIITTLVLGACILCLGLRSLNLATVVMSLWKLPSINFKETVISLFNVSANLEQCPSFILPHSNFNSELTLLFKNKDLY